MRALVIGLIFLALIAAGGTAYLARQFLTAPATTVEVPVRAEPQATMILVAAQDIPAGAILSQSSFAWQPWPAQSVEPDYVVSAPDASNRAQLEEQFIETVARRGIADGSPLNARLVFRRDAPGFLAGALGPGKRAVAVPVTAVTGAAGFVLPGDFVDVMLTHDIRRDFGQASSGSPVIADALIRYTSETILHNIRVLAVDQDMNDFEAAAVLVRTVTLEVTPRQAQTLNVAMAMGDLNLALRSLAVDEYLDQDSTFTTDLQISPTLAYAFQSMTVAARQALSDAQAANARAASAAASKSVAPTTQVAGTRVKVYRGGQTSTQDFRTR
jgi:pilus assembly protein CpaB